MEEDEVIDEELVREVEETEDDDVEVGDEDTIDVVLETEDVDTTDDVADEELETDDVVLFTVELME